MPTLCSGQDADLKIENEAGRIWLPRVTPEDAAGYGLPSHPMYVEARDASGQWGDGDQSAAEAVFLAAHAAGVL